MDEWKKKRDIMQRYDITAPIYDRRYAEEQAAKIEAALAHMAIGNESLVLDAGCGTGILFSNVGHEAKTIVGLDISRRSLCVARDRAKRFLNINLVLADADNPPLKDATFDYVFALTLIQNTPNPAKTLHEIKKAGKKDAKFVITGLKKVFSREAFEKLLQDAGLRILSMEFGEKVKCFVAICTGDRH